VLLGRTGRVRAPGLFAFYVAGYSLGRIGEELLRVDPAHHVPPDAQRRCHSGPEPPWSRRAAATVYVSSPAPVAELIMSAVQASETVDSSANTSRAVT
jgi:hypothetical protein